MLTKVRGWLDYAAKAVVAVAVPIVMAALVEIVEGLQGSFVDNPLVVAGLSAVAVFLKSNGPKPV